MSVDSNEYARLSSDSYNDRSQEKNSDKTVSIGGIDYKVLDIENNPKTGYQGTAYRRVDTGEVIIAHRGTEPNIKDARADAGMVFSGRNSQLDDAMKFTERAFALAQRRADEKHQPLNIFITGHSLGGTLAQITAAKYGVHAETFNAYGPKDLPQLGRYGVDVHAPHPNIVNHVRATDVVGAGGAHLGQVKIYAAPQDIESLRHGRYLGGSPLPGNPLLAADISAHSITNFLPGNHTLGESVMNEANEARARAYAAPIALYRHDVMQGRIDLHAVAANGLLPIPIPIPTVSGVRLGMQAADAASTVVAEKATQTLVSGALAVGHGARAVGHAAGQAYDAARDSVVTGTQRAGHALEDVGQKFQGGASRTMDKLTHPGSWFSSQAGPVPLLNDGQHPGNGFYKQALAGLEKINAEHGIPSDQRTFNAAGMLATSACESRFEQIDHVVLGSNGTKLIAVQGTPGAALSKLIGVDTVVALNTPLAQSSQAFADAYDQQQNQRSQQVNQPVHAQTGAALA